MFLATLFIETTCFIFAVFFLRNTGSNVWNVVKWFLLFTLLNESAATIIGKVYHKHNLWLFNLYTLVNFLVVNWVLYNLSPQQKNNRAIFRVSQLLFVICFSIEMYHTGIFEYAVYSNILSDITLFAICSRFFYLLLKDDSWIDIQNHAAFWFVTGLLLFNLCAIIADLFDDQLSSLYILPNISLHLVLYIVFNLILYGCWSFSFICKYQETI